MTTDDECKRLVCEAWNNACNGGYRDFMETSTREEIAIDMRDCDADLGEFTLEQIEEALKEFKP